MEVFSESGYQRGTMSEVARRVGVTEPVVFQNFGSKAAVFAAVIDAAADQMSAMLREQVAARGSFRDWLHDTLAPEHMQHLHARGTPGVLFADTMSLTSDPAIADAARQAHATIAGALTELFARARRDGDVAGDLDPEAGAWWLLSLLASQEFRRAALPEGDRGRVEARLGTLTLRAFTGR